MWDGIHVPFHYYILYIIDGALETKNFQQKAK